MPDFIKTISTVPKLQTKILSLKSQDFRSFFKNVKKVSTPVVSFYFKPNQLGLSRLGMVVKKKYIKTAVGRNRIKRLIREQFRPKMSNFQGYDLVVFLNKPRDKAALDSFRSDLETQWSKLESFYQRYLSN